MTQRCKCGWTGLGLARHRRTCSERREVEVIDRGPWRWDARLMPTEVVEICTAMNTAPDRVSRRKVLSLRHGLEEEAIDWIAQMDAAMSNADSRALYILVAPQAAKEAERMRTYAAAARLARLNYASSTEHRLVLAELERALFARAERLEWEFA